jgi:electron transport complex protein RnfD
MKFKTKLGPYITSKVSTKAMMRDLFISLIPIILFAYYKNGYLLYANGKITLIDSFYPLLMILTGALTSFITESILISIKERKINKEKILGAYSFYPGLFIALVVSINTPLYLIALASFIASLIKVISGGFAKNRLNPALTGAVIILLFFSSVVSNNGGYLNKLEVDGVSKATPLTNIRVEGELFNYDKIVKPYGFDNIVLGFIPGALGETSSLLIIIALIYLIVRGTIKWRIPITYITTVYLMTLIIGVYSGAGIWYPMFQILTGGLLFGAAFMATDPVTSPITIPGQFIYGSLLGILTVLIRYHLPYPEGVCISILIMNLFVPFIDKIGIKCCKKKSTNILIMATIWLIFTLAVSYTGYVTKVDHKEEVDPKYTLINEDNGVYIVEQKSFGGPLKVKLTFKHEKLVDLEILSCKDSYKHLITDEFLESLVTNYNNVLEVDGISGVTISSNALKKVVHNTYLYHKKSLN